MNIQRLLTVTLVILLVAAASTALARGLEDEPGYVDLEWIEIPDDAEEVQDIDLTSMLKDIAKDVRADGNDELANLVGMIRGLRVKWFSVGDGGEVKPVVDKVLKQLKKDGWQRIVYDKDGEELVSVHAMNNDDGNIVGVTLVYYEPGDSAGFVNLIGDIDIAKLISMAGEIDIDDLDQYIEAYEGDEKLRHAE